MKKFMFLLVALSFCVVPAYAQKDYPRAEAFVGYSHYSQDVNIRNPFDLNGNDFFNQREGMHGVGFSVAGNFSKHLGVVGDFSYHKKGFDVPGGTIDSSIWNFMAGPRFTARADRVEGFGHVLIGGVRRKLDGFSSDTSFALGVGGGMDIKVSRNFGVRLFQVDYLPFRERDPFSLENDWRHNVRVQVGVTFRVE